MGGEQAFASELFSLLSPSLGSPHCTSLARVMLQKSAQDLIRTRLGAPEQPVRGWRAPSRGRRALPRRRAQWRGDGAVGVAATVPRSPLTTETQLPHLALQGQR